MNRGHASRQGNPPEIVAESDPETGVEGNPEPGGKKPSMEPSAQIAGDRQISGQADAPIQALFEYNAQSETFDWSDASIAARLIGTNIAEPTSRADFESRVVGGDVSARTRALSGEAQSYACAYQLRRDDNEAHWVEERGGWIGAGAARRLIGVIQSIERRKRHEEKLAWLAEYDELTGVLNRTQLRARLDEGFAAMKEKNTRGAYLIAGIDDLGAINADFGFDIADEVIVEIANRIKKTLQPGDAIGRVAGTKFGLIFADASEESIRESCIRLLNVVRANVIDTKRGAVAASICLGAVDLPEDADTAHGAMARAEAALDQAKRLGRSSWSPFNEKTDVVSQRRRNTHMSDVILTALNDRRVRLAFQPIVNDLGEAPSKFECLIRMRGEDNREVGAPEFIPIAERLGLVHLLDRRVLELALNTLGVCPNIRLNVNVSMETVKDPVWAEGYLANLRTNEALARRITVELTETQVIDAIESSIEFVTEVKNLGSSFAIDDFGAGYTSFRNLKALDIDVLKIDGSFVTGVASSRENQLFVRTLLDLARNFGMKTVAEWVDNEADAMLLKGLGVDYLQGYLIGKPEINPGWLPDGAPNDAPSMPKRG